MHPTTDALSQLLSRIGKLAFACKVIPAGRICLRWLLDTAHSVEELERKILITEDTCKDIEWWLRFASEWNGTGFFLEPDWTPADEFQLFTDAAGTLGYGAFWNGHWFSEPWPAHLHKSIEWKELYAIVIACKTWISTGLGRSCSFTVTTMQLCASGYQVVHALQTLWTWYELSSLLPLIITFMLLFGTYQA